MKHTILLVFLLVMQLALSLYSPYYKRCRLNKNYTDNDAIPIENLSIERIPKYYSSFYIEPVADPEQQLNYQNFTYFYHEYIDAGGSGEVYLVEDEQTGQGKIVKRYFK